MLQCFYVAMLLCCNIIMLQYYYVAMLLCCNVIMLQCNYVAMLLCCLLYTSDAADEEDSVDLGGRRIIKKNNLDSSFFEPKLLKTTKFFFIKDEFVHFCSSC